MTCCAKQVSPQRDVHLDCKFNTPNIIRLRLALDPPTCLHPHPVTAVQKAQAGETTADETTADTLPGDQELPPNTHPVPQ